MANAVDPFAALRRSEADRARWSKERPTDFAKLMWRSDIAQAGRAGGRVPEDVPQTSNIPKDKSGRTVRDLAEDRYSGEVRLDQLEKTSQKTMKPICNGC
ncbi:hypothetical protein M446_0579 [Methylobacterium sp. 4-46]|uniref:hypothetical protein n=1 Tax=unclassified Methylobacterium TaxID=2615210 RepID=UPI000165CA42|nr:MULTISPECIES: hypothetical protein [Methylobacterium]ACA15141.1 hypothetical protein M446_0579 [Methylobacterium sp. 4-46]WFT80874.1 hypothetical protein QA634_02935 [Methylobacterium nodulans]